MLHHQAMAGHRFMTVCRTTLRSVISVCILLSSPLHAANSGLADGQAFSVRQFQTPALDIVGRLDSEQEKVALRLTTPRYAEHFVIFFEVAQRSGELTDVAINGDADYSGNGKGVGVYYTGLADWRSMTSTLKIAVYSEEATTKSALSVSGRSATATLNKESVTLALLYSPRKINQDNGLNGYLSMGANLARVKENVHADGTIEAQLSSQDLQVKPQLEVGFVYPYRRFSLYTAVGYEEKVSLSLGIRYHINRFNATSNP